MVPIYKNIPLSGRKIKVKVFPGFKIKLVYENTVLKEYLLEVPDEET